VYTRAIRYRWLQRSAENAERLAGQLARSAHGRPGCRGVRVLSALDGGREGLVVFEWETREGLEAHASTSRLENVAPWAIPLLQWRTDQSYESLPIERLLAAGATA
jgi:heme-degrading monooxygenase HmoA